MVKSCTNTKDKTGSNTALDKSKFWPWFFLHNNRHWIRIITTYIHCLIYVVTMSPTIRSQNFLFLGKSICMYFDSQNFNLACSELETIIFWSVCIIYRNIDIFKWNNNSTSWHTIRDQCANQRPDFTHKTQINKYIHDLFYCKAQCEILVS